MKAGVLKQLLDQVADDADVCLAYNAKDYWQNVHVCSVRRLESETAVWDATGQSYRLLKAGQSVTDYEDEEHPHLQVLVLK